MSEIVKTKTKTYRHFTKIDISVKKVENPEKDAEDFINFLRNTLLLLAIIVSVVVVILGYSRAYGPDIEHPSDVITVARVMSDRFHERSVDVLQMTWKLMEKVASKTSKVADDVTRRAVGVWNGPTISAAKRNLRKAWDYVTIARVTLWVNDVIQSEAVQSAVDACRHMWSTVLTRERLTHEVDNFARSPMGMWMTSESGKVASELTRARMTSRWNDFIQSPNGVEMMTRWSQLCDVMTVVKIASLIDEFVNSPQGAQVIAMAEEYRRTVMTSEGRAKLYDDVTSSSQGVAVTNAWHRMREVASVENIVYWWEVAANSPMASLLHFVVYDVIIALLVAVVDLHVWLLNVDNITWLVYEVADWTNQAIFRVTGYTFAPKSWF